MVYTFFIEVKSNVKSPLSSLLNKENVEPNTEKEDTQKEKEDQQTREQSWRRMKITLACFGLSFACIGGYLVVTLGKPPVGDDGVPRTDQFSQYPLPKQYVMRALNEMEYYKNVCCA